MGTLRKCHELLSNRLAAYHPPLLLDMKIRTISAVANVALACVLVVLCIRSANLGSAVTARTNAATMPRVSPKSCNIARNVHVRGMRSNDVASSRRGFMQAGTVASIGSLMAPAVQAKGLKGLVQYKDTGDKYSFYYPFGWEELYVKGTDILYKDIIEPLETASVTLIGSQKESIKEYGDIADVCGSLAEKVLTPPDQKVKVLSAKEKVVDGTTYYIFE